MKRFRDPVFALIVYGIGLIIISFGYYFIPNDLKNIVNYISITGTFSSVYGILVAYAQIMSVRETAENTKLKIEKSNKRVMKILSVSDLSKAIKIIPEIQNYLSADKDESALMRLKDLKGILLNLKFIKDIEELTSDEKFVDALNELSIHSANLSKAMMGTKTGLNKSKIISDLDNIENQLNEFEGYLKYGNYD